MKRLVTSLLASFLLLSVTAFSQDCDLTGWRFFIDPGHGGSDSGAVGPTGLREKDVALDVGLQLRDWLEYFGAAVRMSRTSDIFVSLTARANQANSFGANRFSSVHMNSFSDPSANGTEVFVIPNPRPVTRDLGQQILNLLVDFLGSRNRGLKFANFAVLVRTSMPAALSESLFISNPNEEAILRDPDARSVIAIAHAYGICLNAYAFAGAGEGSDFDEMGLNTLSSQSQTTDPYTGGLKIIGVVKGERRLLGPRFSPDGNFIAFSQATYKGLYIADMADLQPQRLTAEPAAGFGFTWSPDSRAIAFAPREKNGYAVKVVKIADKDVEEVTRSKNPVRTEFQSNGDLTIVGADNADITVVSKLRLGLNDRTSDAPSAVAYIKDEQVWVETGGERKQITSDELSYSDPKLNPARDKILVVGSSYAGSSLFVIDLKTKEKYDLSLLGVGRSGEHNLGYEGAWSPDGKRVLFSLTRDNGYTHVASDLYVIDYDGKNLIQLTDDGSVKLHPDWSARNQIAFEDNDGRIVIAQM